MNNKYILWMRKHPIWTVVGIFFIIGFIVSNTPNAPSFATPKSAQVQEIQTPTPTPSPTPKIQTSISEEKSAVVKTVAPSVAKTETPKPTIPTEYKSALNKAMSYANIMHMSKRGVYEQLISEYGEKFSVAAAQYAIDNMKADWNANALAKARSYQNIMNMSPAAIHDQLVSEHGEKFAQSEADYALQHLND